MKEQYHEVYGWMPTEIINHLPSEDRQKMFLNWILKKPTSTGWFITRTVVASLGDKFITYMVDGIIRALEENDEPVTKDVLIDELTSLMESFSTDANILADYVREYREEVLGLDDDYYEDEKEEGRDIVSRSKTFKRDSQGRFTR
jgi:hypothetical protein